MSNFAEDVLKRSDEIAEEERASTQVPNLAEAYQESLKHPDVVADQPKGTEEGGRDVRGIELTSDDDFLPYLHQVEGDYDLREQAYTDGKEGTTRAPTEVSNKYLRPGKRTVHGIDVATGERILDRDTGIPEAEEAYEAGVQKLRDSSFSVTDGQSPEAMDGLTDVARGVVLEDGTREDFDRKVNMMGVRPEEAALAWDLGNLSQDSQDAAAAIQSAANEMMANAEELTQEPPQYQIEDLPQVPEWLEAARYLYEVDNDAPFEGDDQALSDWAVDAMSAYNWNLSALAWAIASAHKNGPDYADKMLTLLDVYDRTAASWSTVPKNMGWFAADPMNLISLGGGIAAKTAGKVAVNKAAQKVLNHIATQGAIAGGVEGGMSMAGIDAGEQSLEILAGRREEWSPGQTAAWGGAGLVGGMALGGAIAPAIKYGAPKLKAGYEHVKKNAMSGGNNTGPLRSQIGAINPNAAAPLKMHQVPYEYIVDSGEAGTGSKMVKVINPVNVEKQSEELEILAASHPDPLASEAAWIELERDLLGTQEVPPIPYKMIRQVNDMEDWAADFGRLNDEQLTAAAEGFEAVEGMKSLYEDGVATPATTSKLFLWGMLSRMLSAGPHESAFLDAVTNEKLEEFIELAMDRPWKASDIAAYRDWVKGVVPEGAPGKQGTSNLNDFGGQFLAKLSQKAPDGRSKLEHLHEMVSDRSMSSAEVRRKYYGLGTGLGIKNKVLSFILLMTGRDDVMVLDRIQINTLWDSGRYGKLIYDDLAPLFDDAHGLARYEALERSLLGRMDALYQAVGRPDQASVGRYHWESWVNNSGQVVGHPTITGLEREGRKVSNPYADLGAPEGRYHEIAYGATYARAADGTPYMLYNDSSGQAYRFTVSDFKAMLTEIRGSKTKAGGVLPKGFKIKDYKDAGYPWYEVEGVDRAELDRLIQESGTPISREKILREAEQAEQTNVPGEDAPPASNSQRTQVATTVGSYVKADNLLKERGVKGKILDFGAGLGKGTAKIGSDDYEPFPKEGYTPKYTDPGKIPDESYGGVVNLNVLNVVPPEIREQIVQDIARVLKPGGQAVIGTRRWKGDVANTKNFKPTGEENAIITGRETYQKGIEPAELIEYLQEILGDGFKVERINNIAASGAVITKLKPTKATKKKGK